MNYLDKTELNELSIDELLVLKVQLNWALKSKEDAEKITVFLIEEYEGVARGYLKFENALEYVMKNTEAAYKRGLEEFVSKGRPSYISLEGYAPRIKTRLYLPSEIEQGARVSIIDKEED